MGRDAESRKGRDADVEDELEKLGPAGHILRVCPWFAQEGRRAKVSSVR